MRFRVMIFGCRARPERMMKSLVNKVLSALVAIFVATLAHAQSVTPLPPAPEQTGLQTTTQTSSRDSASSTLAKPAYLTSISGLQGVLAETIDGAIVAEQSSESKFNPASSVKLATSLVALHTLGPDHRFVTALWTSGTIDESAGTLNGDLVITGRDPSLHYEHAVTLARQLNELGIHNVTGNLIVAPGFTMNFDWSAGRSGEVFRDSLDSTRRPAVATRAWLDERAIAGENASLSNVPSVVVAGQVQVGTAPAGARPLLLHKSSKLVDILKAMLCYSNNFMAERIGDTLGGPHGVSSAAAAKLKINPDELSLSSTSGLGINRVTPRAMMKILRGLREELAGHNLFLTDILPVAGIDPGTLEDRYTDPLERGTVVAKTGTLVRTDGGASSLVGEMKTKSGRSVLFVVMNQSGNVVRFRQNQDAIVSAIQNSLGGPAPFDYRPVKLAIRLANSEYEAAKARGEVEPRDQ